MISTRKCSQVLLTLSLGFVYTASAEDVDIFLNNEAITGVRPNVLLVLDNAASNNSNITMLDGVSSGKKLEMLRQVLNNIIDPLNSPYFPACVINADKTRTPAKCITRGEVSDLLKNINLGLMIANPSGAATGAYVRYHVRRMDEDANRSALVAKINPGIPEANNAPYAKSMHEAYQYFGGKVDYVGFDSKAPYDAGAKGAYDAVAKKYKYVSPISDYCQDNYILFVGNGGPDSGEENDTKKLLTGIGGILVSDPIKFTPSNLTSSWFDEYARTLKKQDVSPVDGVQNVTTYTIAVQNPADNNYDTATMESSRKLLESAADQGGGEYFEASNGQEVMRAFVDMLQKFQAIDSVFAASTLPVSVNVRGTFLNQVYMGQFRPDAKGGPRWPGNLKQYKIALVGGQPVLADKYGQGVEDTTKGFILPDKTSFWSTTSTYWTFDPMGTPKTNSDAPDGNIVEKGGAAQRMRQDFATTQATRKLYTCNGSCSSGGLLSTNEFATSNTGITKELLGAADADERTALINWVRGADNIDNEDSNDVSTDIRARIHGDLLHSRPAVVNYNRYGDERDIMVFYGTNGGIFHAVKGGQDDADGGEKWGMVFPEFFDKLKRLRDNSPKIEAGTPKPYFADGAVSIYQHDANNDGKFVAGDDDKVYLYVGMRRGGRFAYALDVSDPDKPKHLWKIDNSMGDFAELGQTWSSLRPAKIRALPDDPVVIFGAGYDPENEDELPSKANDEGRGIFFVNGRTGALIKHINPAGMGSVPADLAVVDRDDDGYFDRIYAADTKGNVWRVDIDAASPSDWKTHHLASLGGGGTYVRKFLNKPDVVFGSDYDAVLLGSGDREHPFETTVTNRFYMLKDTNVGLNGDYICATADVGRACVDSDLEDVTGSSAPASTGNGWYVTLSAGEKVVGSAITVFGTTFFGTNRPTPPEAGVCSSNLGEARLYAVGFDTGIPSADINADGVVDSADLFEEVPGGGFPPPPVYARVEVEDGNKKKQVDVVCTGSHCLSPGGVTTTTKRYRTYWHIDSNPE